MTDEQRVCLCVKCSALIPWSARFCPTCGADQLPLAPSPTDPKYGGPVSAGGVVGGLLVLGGLVLTLTFVFFLQGIAAILAGGFILLASRPSGR